MLMKVIIWSFDPWEDESGRERWDWDSHLVFQSDDRQAVADFLREEKRWTPKQDIEVRFDGLLWGYGPYYALRYTDEVAERYAKKEAKA